MPLTTYHSSDDLRRALALRDARYETFAGVTHEQPRATFSGRAVEPDPQARGPFHRYNAAERQLYFSPYHLTRTSVGQYIAALTSHRPVWITGYASSLNELCRLAASRGLVCPSLEAAISIAEPVPAGLRERAVDVFGCQLTEEYGMAEEVAFALECPKGRLHVSPDAGVIEILDEDGRSCPPGEVGEIVATGLLREAQPLVRYRTGDLASWSSACCDCGREMPVIEELEGRIDDAIVTPDGRRISRLTAVTRNLPGVVYAQFVQEERTSLHVRVVLDGVLDEALTGEITNRLRRRLGNDLRIVVEQVDTVERTARGKVRSTIRDFAQ